MRQVLRAAALVACALVPAAALAGDDVRVVKRSRALRKVPVVALAVPDADHVLSAEADGYVRRYEIATGKITDTWGVPDAVRRCQTVVLSPDGTEIAGAYVELAGAMSDGSVTLRVARLDDGAIVREVVLEGGTVLDLRRTTAGWSVLTDAVLVSYADGEGEPRVRVEVPETKADPELEALGGETVGYPRGRIGQDGDSFVLVQPLVGGARVVRAGGAGPVVDHEGPVPELLSGGDRLFLRDLVGWRSARVDDPNAGFGSGTPDESRYGHLGPVLLEASPGGGLVAVLGDRLDVRAAGSGEVVASASEIPAARPRPAWSPEGAAVAYPMKDGRIAVLDTSHLAARMAGATERRGTAAALSRVRDASGALLPPGAVGRIGSGFLRTGSPVIDAVWSGDGRIVVATRDRPPVAWDLGTRKVAAVSDDARLANALALVPASSSGSVLVVAGVGRSDLAETSAAHLLDRDLRIVRTFGADAEAYGFAVSDDGARVAGLLRDGLVVWDAADGSEQGRLPLDIGPEPADDVPTTLVFAPGGGSLLLGTFGGDVVRWSGRTGDAPETVRADVTEGPFRALRPSPDGTAVAWHGFMTAGVVRLDAASGQDVELPPSSPPRSLHRPLPFEWLDSERLLVLAETGPVVVDALFGEVLERREGGPEDGVRGVSPDGTRLLMLDFEGVVRVVDAADGKVVAGPDGHAGLVTALVASDDGALLASAATDDDVRLWDVATGTERTQLDAGGVLVNGLAFDPSGETLVVTGAKRYPGLGSSFIEPLIVGSVRAFDVATGERRWVVHGEQEIGEARTTRDGAYVAVVRHGRRMTGASLHVQALADGADVPELDLRGAHAAFDVLPPGGLLVARLGGLYALPPRGPARELVKVEGVDVRDLTRMWLLADQLHVLARTADPVRLHVLSLEDGSVAATVATGMPSAVCAVSPDGGHVVVAGDGLRVYALPSGEEVVTWDVERLDVMTACFLPGSTRFVTGSAGGDLLVWDLDVLLGR